MTLAHVERGAGTASEGLVDVDGEGFYCIPRVDRIPPFLMSVVSDGDRWMFVSSAGSLTAGRVDATRALFPYETDDRLHRNLGFVGPVSAIRVEGGRLWQPFQGRPDDAVTRTLLKSVVGDSVIFEEFHSGLGLRFMYRWKSSEELGFIRSVTLTNEGDRPVRADVIDGLVGLLPYGLQPALYQRMSNLTNAYKRSEALDPSTRLTVFTLESGVVDRPEPAEVLRGTSVWSVGLDGATVTVSPDAIEQFISDDDREPVHLLTGRPGAHLLDGRVELQPGEATTWHIVADVAQDQLAVSDLQRRLGSPAGLGTALTEAAGSSSEFLVRIMAPADALQRTGDRVATAHQFANVTYNVMRGGVPLNGYQISTADFGRFLSDRNTSVKDRHDAWLRSLPPMIDRSVLLEGIDRSDDPQLVRLGLEYLPFGFARRHGDPSRPWNEFSIRVREDDQPILYYEGNWRDIFQNWEALCMSFPEFLPNVIAVFVNASTPDGFNPYRITRSGIDWEVPDPEDPWSSIGYWGDHQIVYLLRLLEESERYLPGRIAELLSQRLFSYADVPYRLAPYDHLVQDPKSTIRYDEESAARSSARVGTVGGDGRLLCDGEGEVHLTTLAEKILVPALAKLSNFVPGGGIWMNTQRPEWNDANNALVGFGLSMVTLSQLRRYLHHLRGLFDGAGPDGFPMSTEVTTWLRAVAVAMGETRPGELGDTDRKRLMDDLGRAFTEYRSAVYGAGFSGDRIAVGPGEIVALCDRSIAHLDATIRANRRTDGLFHSYNLIHFTEDGDAATVEHLFEMLEGQVAALESGVLSPEERADVLDALFASDMYREDQDSFMLYPVRTLPSFLEKNVIPTTAVEGNDLLSAMIGSGERSMIDVDDVGRFRFNADFANRRDLELALDEVSGDPEWDDMVTAHRAATLDAYEQVFGHHSYTGRSGSMYGYEGIGSIYWHMVAKLLVAVQASVVEAACDGAPHETVARLVEKYWRVRSGLGFNKTAAQFGAIPIDPYSHTPAHAGAQQPGMTGLVKEELLTRPLEVGVAVQDGQIRIDPILLRPSELLTDRERWSVWGPDLRTHEVDLPKGSLGTTLCQVPIVVETTVGESAIDVHFEDGTIERVPGLVLSRDVSAHVFARSGAVTRIHAHVPGDLIGA